MRSQRASLMVALFVLATGRLFGVEVANNRFYPQEAFLVTVADRANLQTRLDFYGAIRLEKGDYLAGNSLTSLTIRSGNRIFGLGNDMPTMVVAPGTTDAIVSAVHGQLIFPASNLVTSQNLFRHINYSNIQILGGTLERNLFLDVSFSQLSIDHSSSGYWSGNRIIRFLTHSVSPMLAISGRTASRALSHGNVFVWLNSLGALGEIINIADQRDLNVVYMDCEAYYTTDQTALTVRRVDDLSIFSTSGLLRTGRTIDQGATSLWLHGHEMGSIIAPTVIQRAANATSVITEFNPDMRLSDEANASAQRFQLFSTSSTSTTRLLNGVTITPPLAATPAAALMRTISTARSDPSWERPTFSAIPDPAGASWNADLANKVSSRATIQNEINTKGVAVLGQGIFYLDGPLTIGPRQGLVGAGMDRTVLIALNTGIDLITSNSSGAVDILLADITLQGGRAGIHHTTSGAQFTGMTISHVTIRDTADSGIWLENIYAWDNNWIDFLNIYHCPTGIKQRAPSGPASDSTPNLTYLDKNVFYQCQFVGCQRALDLRGNRASAGNTWVNCLFQNNSIYAASMSSHNSVNFTNCDFKNNGGHPSIFAQGQLYMVGCTFDDTNSGVTDFVDGISVSLEGCVFSRQGSSTAVITAANPTWIDISNPSNNTNYRNHHSHFFNCLSTNVPINLMFAGLTVNSSFPDRPDLSVNAAMVTNEGTTVSTLVTGTVNPSTIRTQLLVGAVFPPSMTAETAISAPSLNSPTVVNNATVGSVLAYAITALNFPTSYSVSALPSWLTFTANTGLITGTPTSVGAFSFTVTATNSVGADTQTVTINVSAAVTGSPVIGGATTVTAYQSTPFTYQIVASNSPTSYNAASLPPGLSVNTANGLISGTPTQIENRISSISATNALGTNVTNIAFVVLAQVLTPPTTTTSSSNSGGGGSGCGFGATAAALMLSVVFLRLRRQA